MKRGFGGSLKALSALLLSGALLTGAAVTAFAQAQTYNVQLESFRIVGAPASVRAGSTLNFNATSSTNPHNLAIDGMGVDIRPTVPNLGPGTSGVITLQAPTQPGTYTLYCPVGQHRANGMEVKLQVVAGAAMPATGGPALPLGLAGAGLFAGATGLVLRRRAA